MMVIAPVLYAAHKIRHGDTSCKYPVIAEVVQ